jgi:inosine-uridine nucleoside N-ribohydrolase
VAAAPIPVVIDTDPGVDDALALLLASASPEIEVLALTTVGGNTGLDRVTENARRVAAVAWPRRPPPIYRGLDGAETAEEVHGIDGLGGATLLTDADGPRYPAAVPLEDGSAVRVLADLVGSRPGEVVVITLGPLTNLAAAIREFPAALAGVREIVIMGGAFQLAGNLGPVTEFNVAADAEAAKTVCDSGLPQRWVPLNVSEQCLLRRADLDALPNTPRARFVRDCIEVYLGYHVAGYGEQACFLHDPLAVGAVLWPELLRCHSVQVDVETEGRVTRGMTLADFRPPAYRPNRPANAFVALEVRAAEFVRRFLARLP